MKKKLNCEEKKVDCEKIKQTFKKNWTVSLLGHRRNDSTRQGRQKNVFVFAKSCPDEALIRMWTINLPNITTWLKCWFTEYEIKSSPCSSVTEREPPSCFGSLLRRSKRGAWLLLTRSKDIWLFEISLLNAMKFLKRLSQGLQNKCGNYSPLWRER